jgi:hypothetical protein
MSQTLTDHVPQRDDSDNLQRALKTCGAFLYGDGNHLREKSGPAPARWPSAGLRPLHSLMARIGGDGPEQVAVWRQTSASAERSVPEYVWIVKLGQSALLGRAIHWACIRELLQLPSPMELFLAAVPVLHESGGGCGQWFQTPKIHVLRRELR